MTERRRARVHRGAANRFRPIHCCGAPRWSSDSRVIGLARGTRSAARSNTEKDDDGPIEPDDVGIGKLAYTITEPRTTDRRDLVDHEPARLVQPVVSARLDLHPKQWRLSAVSRKRTYRHGVGIEPVVLEDDCWPRFAGVVTATGDGPDLASSHSSGQSDTESTKAWSSALCSLAATALAWRCASAANPGARTSGTQICTGRSPWARKRARCSATRCLDAPIGAMMPPSLHVTIAGVPSAQRVAAPNPGVTRRFCVGSRSRV